MAEGRVSEQEGMSVNLPKSKAKRAHVVDEGRLSVLIKALVNQ